MPTFTSVLRSPIGNLKIAVDERGTLLRVALSSLLGHDPNGVEDDARCAHVVTQLQEYFAGTRTKFELQLAPAGTEFQQRAWHALRSIPYGETSTYEQQAERIERPSAVRAVGAANGKNPIMIVVPCHRVIGKDGSLVGFSGGLDKKKWLLCHEMSVVAERRKAGQFA